MGVRGGAAPDGLKQRHLRTLFLRAPFADWPALSQGYKTEFRAPMRGKMAERFQAPTPVVLYAVSPATKRRFEKLMVLTEHRTQTLMDIKDDPGALMREGFDSYDAFRSYWRARTRREYVPMAKVEVFRLREWIVSPGNNDELTLGAELLERLYGDYF